ncbi:hypothetical protein [Halapricum hydrolyticum]|uniref:Uncharacterized protein n=1 Tax=Halapricum hydrolyticum TaxID=2979991 RepID=A0AAE3ICV9_9EURY|nr:hypothetical protein [Halapricum hydrolyticum]MCU4718983.1 hypothetical protein [Halapricum hydrolyticum]MCU4727912.1 hypothetical protein [Halapricum hydrolyticum]
MSGTHGGTGRADLALALLTFGGIVAVTGWIANSVLGELSGIDRTGTVEGWYLILGVLMPVLAILGVVAYSIWSGYQ